MTTKQKGDDVSTPVWPTELRYNRATHILHVTFDAKDTFDLSAEYLRVLSPSAEVQGHGGAPMPPVTAKKNVGIEKLEPVGNYAVRIIFDDGHDSGLFTWEYLYKLGQSHDRLWTDYLTKLERHGGTREP